MSDDDTDRPPVEDPFRAEDPAAVERERRRQQREAKRRGRDNRQSLGSRVSGALDGAAAKGREAIEQTRERAKSPEPQGDGVEPPAFRRPPAAPDPGPPPPRPDRADADDEGRVAAEVLMPRRETRRPAFETAESDAIPPDPIPAARPVGSPGPAESEEWSVPPPPVPVDPAPAASGSGGGSRRHPSRAAGAGAVWRRRALALAAILAIAGGGAYALSKAGGEEAAAPAPAGPKTLKTTSVTIPEGLGFEEVAAVAKDAGLRGSYEKATEKLAPKFKPERYGAPKGSGLEGFLFPATYEVEKGAPATDLVDKQLTEGFEPNFSGIDLGYAKKKNLSAYDVVTIASMIEREVQVPAERPLVAAVIYNRLADGEALGIDATLRYEVGFDEPLTESQLASESPYNTRLVAGLPPTPIGNPGLDSLEAAANPAKVDFKYYVFKPGTCGEHTFTADYDEFLTAQADYQAALEAEGGQPSDC